MRKNKRDTPRKEIPFKLTVEDSKASDTSHNLCSHRDTVGNETRLTHSALCGTVIKYKMINVV